MSHRDDTSDAKEVASSVALQPGPFPHTPSPVLLRSTLKVERRESLHRTCGEWVYYTLTCVHDDLDLHR